MGYFRETQLSSNVPHYSVIAGPWQFGKVDQGVFTLWMFAHYFKNPLEYIGFGGKGKQVRDLLHIDDLFELVELQLRSMNKINGRVYNIGGGDQISLSLLEATSTCAQITSNKINVGENLQTRPADVIVYISDNRKAHKDLAWEPKRSPQKILEDIYSWIRANEQDLSTLYIK